MSLFTSPTHPKTLIKHPKKPKRPKTFIKHPKKPKCPKTFIKHPKKPKRLKTKHPKKLKQHKHPQKHKQDKLFRSSRTSKNLFSSFSMFHSPDRGRSTTRNLPRLTNDSTSKSNI